MRIQFKFLRQNSKIPSPPSVPTWQLVWSLPLAKLTKLPALSPEGIPQPPPPLLVSVHVGRVEHRQPSQSKGGGGQPHPVPKHAFAITVRHFLSCKNTSPPAQPLNWWVQPPFGPPGSSCDSGREKAVHMGGQDPRLGRSSVRPCCSCIRAMERWASPLRGKHSRT